MPRIDSLRIGFLWIAFTVNDLQQYGKPRFGFSEERAKNRVFKKLWTEGK